MADSPRRPVKTSDSLSGLVKLAVDLRLILLLAAMGAALFRGADRPVLALMLLASYAGVGLLLWWEKFVPHLRRYPILFVIDLAITVAILATAGVDGPFVLYTISTSFLAGALYGYVGGTIFGGGIAVGYASVASKLSSQPAPFTLLVSIPVLILVAGLGAAALRELLLRSAQVQTDLDAAVAQAAAAEERCRLAREMHDSLGKTLHGISLSAAALPKWVQQRPGEAADKALKLSEDARTAASEARKLISDLRSDEVNAPLHTSVMAWAQEWQEKTGIAVSLAVSPVGRINPQSRYELFTILREAMRNVAAHATATSVSVYLCQDGPNAVLEVADDGSGIACTDLELLASQGHYGVVGMQERARRAGGVFSIQDSGNGTILTAVVPLTSDTDPDRPAHLEPPAVEVSLS